MRRKLPAPSIRRILNMSVPVLLEHNALVYLRKSSLSSAQRRRVQTRTQYLVELGQVTKEEVQSAIENLIKQYKL